LGARSVIAAAAKSIYAAVHKLKGPGIEHSPEGRSGKNYLSQDMMSEEKETPEKEGSSNASQEVPSPVSVAEAPATLSDIAKLLNPIQKMLESLNKRTGILVEEKARVEARNLFGSDFSKRLLIKSLFEIIKLISKADDPKLPKEYGTVEHTKAVGVVADHIRPFLPFFVRSALRQLSDLAGKPTFDHNEFAPGKKKIAQVVELLEEEKPEVEPDFLKICGLLIEAVKALGTENQVGSETLEEKDKRVKTTTGTFKRKLNRLKAGFTEGGLATCAGPGVMICCALSGAPKGLWEKEQDLCNWIAKNSDIHDWMEEVECDLRGSVMLAGANATISSGEIKSSMHGYGEAAKQMKLRVGLIEFVLQLVFENRFTNVTKKGHLFVLDRSDENDQQTRTTQDSGEISIFLHSSDPGGDQNSMRAIAQKLDSRKGLIISNNLRCVHVCMHSN
jgi:hypothetical protein